MTHHAAHVMTDAAGRVGQGLALGHFALQYGMREIRRQQRAEKHSVVELAVRLREARADQAAALQHAAEAQAALEQAQDEIAQLRAALVREQAFSAELRSIISV